MLLGVTAFAAFFAMDVTVTATGTLEPALCREVRAQMTGVVDRVYVDENRRVTEGQLLASVATWAIRADLEKAVRELAAARADLDEARADGRVVAARTVARIAEARANLELAYADLDRVSEQVRVSQQAFRVALLGGTAVTDVESVPDVRIKAAQATRAEAQVASAEAETSQVTMVAAHARALASRVARLQAEAAHQQERLAKAEIRSPCTGVVLLPDSTSLLGRRVLEGERVFVVGDVSEWVVRARIPQENAPFVKTDMPARVYVKAFPQADYRVFAGVVKELSPSPALDERGDIFRDTAGRSFFPVTVGIDAADPGGALAPAYGLDATVEIVREREQILRLAWRKLVRVAGETRARERFTKEARGAREKRRVGERVRG